MKKSAVSKSKWTRAYTTVKLDPSDIIGWMRAQGVMPPDAKDIKVLYEYGGRKMELDDEDIVVEWMTETHDEDF